MLALDVDQILGVLLAALFAPVEKALRLASLKLHDAAFFGIANAGARRRTRSPDSILPVAKLPPVDHELLDQGRVGAARPDGAELTLEVFRKTHFMSLSIT